MPRPHTKKLRFETLESRAMCAGNVTAAVSNGALTVTGDNLSNTVSVESFSGGRIQVRGFNTSVNSTFGAPRVFNNVTGGVFINMNGGNDLLRVTNVILPGRLYIDMGAGNDQTVMGHDRAGGNSRFGGTSTGHLATYGDLTVFGRAGNDLLYQSYYHAKTPARIDMGDGDDTVRIQRLPGENRDTRYRGALTILTGTGTNLVNINGMLAQTNFTITDQFNPSRLTFRNVNVQGELVANLGAGSDVVDSSGVGARRMTIKAGPGADLVSVKSTRAVDAIFAGDGDADIYRDSRSLPNAFVSLQRTGFERIQHVS